MRAAAALVLALACVAAYADGPAPVEATDGALTVSLTLDTVRPALGAPVHLRLRATVAGDEHARIVWPDVRAEVRAAVGEEVVEVESARVAPDGRSLDAVLRLYDEGRHALPALAVSAVHEDADGARRDLGAVRLDAPALEVATTVPEDAEPAAARAGLPLVVPPAPFPWLPVAAGVVAAAALLAGVVAWRRRPRVVPPPPPPPPPHERALAALRALRERGLAERGAVEPFFVELSEILRRYLEERFGLRAPEQTTEEFLASVGRTSAGRRAIDAAHREILAEFLAGADLVKFARAVPGPEGCVRAGETVERFVLDTVPAPEPVEEASA